LGKVRGIGRWTVDMILLYTLRRADIFPYDDYHLCQIMPKLYRLNPKQKLVEKMLAIADRWLGQLSLGVLYLLAWKNQNLKKRKR
jgi:DNA-3-methyladenine glycosylase II